MYDELRTAWQELTAPGAPFEVGEVEVRGVWMRAFMHAPPSLRDLWLGSRSHSAAGVLALRRRTFCAWVLW